MPVSAIAAQLRRKILAAVANVIDGIDQVPRRPVLQQIGIRPRPHNFANNLIVHASRKRITTFVPRLSPRIRRTSSMPCSTGRFRSMTATSRPKIANFVKRGLAIRATRDHLDLSVRLQYSGQPSRRSESPSAKRTVIFWVSGMTWVFAVLHSS